MSRNSRARARGTGVMVLDNEGVSQATTDRAMYVRLKVAYDDEHRVLTSAAVLAEVLHGTSRDAGLHRVLSRVAVEPVSEAIGQRAGRLIGAAGMPAAQAVDAMVAATAIAAAERVEAAGQAPSVLIVTADLAQLTRLVGGRTGVAVVHVSELGTAS
jgi:predicted nucleic acid-binding protein